MPASRQAELVVDTDTRNYRATIETDLVAPFVLAREVGRHMLARRQGRIVNIASVLAILGRSSVAAYVAAKHGIVGLTKTLAAEFGPDVTVNAIAPGYIRTDFNLPLQKNKDFSAMLEQRTAALAGAIRKICAARCCCWPPTPAPTSPARPWWSMAA